MRTRGIVARLAADADETDVGELQLLWESDEASFLDLVSAELAADDIPGSLEDWGGVAAGLSIEDGLYNLGVLLWQSHLHLHQAVRAFEIASRRGNALAQIAHVSSLLWLGRVQEAVTATANLKSSSSSSQYAEVAALTGRHLFETGERSSAVEELLRIGASVDERAAIALALMEVDTGNWTAAQQRLLTLVAGGSDLAPIALGNILSDLGETAVANEAYEIGIARGDAFSAFNLATNLRSTGDHKRAREYLVIASDLGDGRAREALRALDI